MPQYIKTENETKNEFVARVVTTEDRPEGITHREVHALINKRRWRCSLNTVASALRYAWKTGLLERSIVGKPGRNNPYTYLPKADNVPMKKAKKRYINGPFDDNPDEDYVAPWVKAAEEVLAVVDEPEKKGAGNLLTTLAIYHGMTVDQVYRVICDTIFTLDADDADDGAALLAVFKGWFN
tara:strand:- start:1862 stop:2404 length:543 start_codon:yes stop_codon:yes gene_type:complete